MSHIRRFVEAGDRLPRLTVCCRRCEWNCHFLDVVENSIACARFMSRVDFFWFMVYAELFDQYVQYMSDTRGVCQKPLIPSDTHLRYHKYDEMGGTSIGKWKVSERAYRIFMFGISFFSMMQDCDHTRPYVDGTADATYTLMFICSRRIHTNHTMMYHPPAAAEALPRRSSRLQLWEPRWWSYGWKIHLEKWSRFRGYLVECFFVVGFL